MLFLLLLTLLRLLLVRLLMQLLLPRLLLVRLLMLFLRQLLVRPLLLMLLLPLVRLLLLLVMFTQVVVLPGPSVSALVTSPAMVSTTIAPTCAGNNKGVSRPIPQFLVARHPHLPVRAEHHFLKDVVRQLCIGEKNVSLHSSDRGKVARKRLVSVDIRENHFMDINRAPEYTTPRKNLVGGFPDLDP